MVATPAGPAPTTRAATRWRCRLEVENKALRTVDVPDGGRDPGRTTAGRVYACMSPAPAVESMVGTVSSLLPLGALDLGDVCAQVGEDAGWFDAIRPAGEVSR